MDSSIDRDNLLKLVDLVLACNNDQLVYAIL